MSQLENGQVDFGILSRIEKAGIRRFPYIFRPLSPILSNFFAKTPPLTLPLLKKMNGSTLISSNPLKTLIFSMMIMKVL